MGHNDNRSRHRVLLPIIAIVLLVIIAVTITVVSGSDDQSAPQAANIATNTQTVSDSQNDSNQQNNDESTADSNNDNERSNTMNITINGTALTATMEDNSSSQALLGMLQSGPLTIDMHDYAGMEKVGTLDTTLPTNDQQITTEPGDIILYQGNQITIYYGNSQWSLTKLGHIDNVTAEELRQLLGSENVTVTLSV